MENNQNRTEETSKLALQPETNREKITPEIDPNNPTTRRDKQNGSIQDNQNPKDKTNPTLPFNQTNTKATTKKNETSDKRSEVVVDETEEIAESINRDSKEVEFKTENPYNKEGGL